MRKDEGRSDGDDESKMKRVQLRAEMRQNSKDSMATNEREVAVKWDLVTVKRELVESRVECASLRRGHN